MNNANEHQRIDAYLKNVFQKSLQERSGAPKHIHHQILRQVELHLKKVPTESKFKLSLKQLFLIGSASVSFALVVLFMSNFYNLSSENSTQDQIADNQNNLEKLWNKSNFLIGKFKNKNVDKNGLQDVADLSVETTTLLLDSQTQVNPQNTPNNQIPNSQISNQNSNSSESNFSEIEKFLIKNYKKYGRKSSTFSLNPVIANNIDGSKIDLKINISGNIYTTTTPDCNEASCFVPIKNANICFKSSSFSNCTQSNEFGFYEIMFDKSGRLTVEVQATNFKSKTFLLDVTEQEYQVKHIRLELQDDKKISDPLFFEIYGFISRLYKENGILLTRGVSARVDLLKQDEIGEWRIFSTYPNATSFIPDYSFRKVPEGIYKLRATEEFDLTVTEKEIGSLSGNLSGYEINSIGQPINLNIKISGIFTRKFIVDAQGAEIVKKANTNLCISSSVCQTQPCLCTNFLATQNNFEINNLAPGDYTIRSTESDGTVTVQEFTGITDDIGDLVITSSGPPIQEYQPPPPIPVRTYVNFGIDGSNSFVYLPFEICTKVFSCSTCQFSCQTSPDGEHLTLSLHMDETYLYHYKIKQNINYSGIRHIKRTNSYLSPTGYYHNLFTGGNLTQDVVDIDIEVNGNYLQLVDKLFEILNWDKVKSNTNVTLKMTRTYYANGIGTGAGTLPVTVVIPYRGTVMKKWLKQGKYDITIEYKQVDGTTKTEYLIYQDIKDDGVPFRYTPN